MSVSGIGFVRSSRSGLVRFLLAKVRNRFRQLPQWIVERSVHLRTLVDANGHCRIRRCRFGSRSLFATLRKRAGPSGRAHHQGQKCPKARAHRYGPLLTPAWPLESTHWRQCESRINLRASAEFSALPRLLGGSRRNRLSGSFRREIQARVLRTARCRARA